MDLRAAIQHARELAAALGPVRVGAIAEGLREGVAEWRWADVLSVAHRPEPYLAIRDRRDGDWREAPDDGTPALRIGLDGEGRVLVVELDAWGERHVAEAWEHHEGELRIFEDDRSRVTARVLYGSPLTTVVWATDGGREFGIERWHRPPDAPMRGEVAHVQVDGWVTARAYEIHLDDHGELDLIAGGIVDAVIEEDTRIPADGVVDALLTQLEEAARIDCGEPLWEARLHRPEPDLRPSPALVDALTIGLAAAIDRAVASAGIDRPFVLEHRPDPDGPLLPGFLRVGSARFRDEMRRFGSGDRDALHLLWKGEDTGEVARIELADHCDAETLRACREVSTATSHLSGTTTTRRRSAPARRLARSARA